MATGSHGVIKTNAKTRKRARITQQLMPDSGALDLTSKISHLKAAKRDRPCQIHGTPDKQANHTNIDCWVFKQAGKLNAENKEKGSQSEDEDEEPRQPNTGGRRNFPLKSKR